mgnify:CR=1 FL=1
MKIEPWVSRELGAFDVARAHAAAQGFKSESVVRVSGTITLSSMTKVASNKTIIGVGTSGPRNQAVPLAPIRVSWAVATCPVAVTSGSEPIDLTEALAEEAAAEAEAEAEPEPTPELEPDHERVTEFDRGPAAERPKSRRPRG